MPKIVLVDDERILRETLKDLLQLEGYEVDVAEDGQEGLKLIGERRPHLVITDMRMPKADGLKVLEGINAAFPNTVVIVITGHGTPETAKAAFEKGTYAYLAKPLDFDELCRTIKQAL